MYASLVGVGVKARLYFRLREKFLIADFANVFGAGAVEFFNAISFAELHFCARTI